VFVLLVEPTAIIPLNINNRAQFQASTEMLFRSALLWDFTQLYWQFVADVSGKLNFPIFKEFTFEDGANRLSRNVGKELPLHAA
jgi:hypothetical protein